MIVLNPGFRFVELKKKKAIFQQAPRCSWRLGLLVHELVLNDQNKPVHFSLWPDLVDGPPVFAQPVTLE